MAEYQAKLQDFKVEAINLLKDLFSNTEDFIFADYRGLNVEQITELRSRLREKGTTFRVIKNRHAKIALNELEYPDVSEFLLGPTAVTLGGEDTGAAAKVLFEFSVDAPVSVKGAIIDGTVFDAEQVEAYSKLPTRDELLAQLLSVMNGPVRNLMYALKAVPEKLVRTLQAVADQKGDE